MNEDTETGLEPEGEALPEKSVADCAARFDKSPPFRGYDSASERVLAAVDRWYAAHFHAAAVAGRAPITAEEKASLVAHVSEAITPKE